MNINMVIAVTDGDWFETLRRQPDIDEVNFWAPSAGKNFVALRPGELFLFKLHSPLNFIVGGGIFAHANKMPCSLAWDAFGASNGAISESEMRKRVMKYRKATPDDRSDFMIGCRILTQPFFFNETDWIPVPRNWKLNIVALKTYNTKSAEGLDLWKKVTNRLRRNPLPGISEEQAPFGKPRLIPPRNGQGAFRVIVRDSYQNRCAVTMERTLPALEAAHIRPYKDVRNHEIRNGILLRRDIHKLFDDGYVTVTPELNFEVSHRIREEFENGRHYYDLHGKRITVPQDSNCRPNPEALTWHNENCYKG